jgi:hypothetical protein
VDVSDMNNRRLTGILCALFLAANVAACGGGGAESVSETKIKTTTVGQELVDLKKALDTGALSKSEYENQRKKILRREE